jgi:hypothetical protein
MKKSYWFHGTSHVTVRDKGTKYDIPYQPGTFEQLLEESLTTCNILTIIDTIGDILIQIINRNVQIFIGNHTTFWLTLFDMIKDIKTLILRSKYPIPHYNWLDQVGSIILNHPNCTPQLLDSGKVIETPYEPWIDVEKYPKILYVISDCIDPRIRKAKILYMKYFQEWEKAVELVKECRNLKTLDIDVRDKQNYFHHFEQIECKKLILTAYKISPIVALNKYESIYSKCECRKEVVDANYTLIGGRLSIRGMDKDQSEKYLQEIFERNRRPVKSARNV